jgi:hypothetical protein
MFELLAVPQRGIPYVQIGFRIILYISNLFSIDNSDFLPRIQYICWNFSTRCFLLANMWVCHVSLLSRWIPKYLAVSPCGIVFDRCANKCDCIKTQANNYHSVATTAALVVRYTCQTFAWSLWPRSHNSCIWQGMSSGPQRLGQRANIIASTAYVVMSYKYLKK